MVALTGLLPSTSRSSLAAATRATQTAVHPFRRPTGMSRPRLWLLALATVLASPASAQIGGTPFEFSGRAGIYRPDARANMKLGPVVEATAGYRFQSWLAVEGYALVASSKTDD